MNAYRSETREIIRRFLASTLSFPECITALDVSLGALMPRLAGGQMPALRVLMLANNDIVMKEMERRGQPDETSA